MDLIAVLYEGLVAETGTHDELIAHSGRCAELFELQGCSYRQRQGGDSYESPPLAKGRR